MTILLLSNFYVDIYINSHVLNNRWVEVKGGPTKHDYNFLQFHMHWGETCERGSEHLIDGEAYSAEVIFYA